jgi:hypothetical protein
MIHNGATSYLPCCLLSTDESLLRHISLATEWFTWSVEPYRTTGCITSRKWWQHGQALQLGKEGHSHLVNVWIDPTFDTTPSLVPSILQGWGQAGCQEHSPVLSCPCEVTSSWPSVHSGKIHTEICDSPCVWWCRVFSGYSKLIYSLCRERELQCSAPSLPFF